MTSSSDFESVWNSLKCIGFTDTKDALTILGHSQKKKAKAPANNSRRSKISAVITGRLEGTKYGTSIGKTSIQLLSKAESWQTHVQCKGRSEAMKAKEYSNSILPLLNSNEDC